METDPNQEETYIRNQLLNKEAMCLDEELFLGVFICIFNYNYTKYNVFRKNKNNDLIDNKRSNMSVNGLKIH